MLGIPTLVWVVGACVTIVAIYYLWARKLDAKPGEHKASHEARS